METTASGKIALVTGGSRGLGRNMALHLARAGHDLIVTYKSRADEAAEAVREIEALGRKAAALQLDAGDIASFGGFAERVAAVLESRFGRQQLDFLVNNGGMNGQGRLGDTDEAVFDSLVDVHFKGVYFVTQALLPRIADGGAILCVSSGLTRMTLPGYGPYAAVKSAVETMVRYWAKELGPRRIRVNTIAPGAIATDFSRAVYDANPQLVGMIGANTALGRIGQPEDIGPVVAFLCSPAAGWVNAQRLEASGGQFL